MPGKGRSTVEELKKSVGVESSPVTYTVERGAVARFADAIDDGNPLYHDETFATDSRYGRIVAPPTFLRSMRPNTFGVSGEGLLDRVLDGGSEWEYIEPVLVGDRITVTEKVVDVVERSGRLGNMIFITREVRYVNQTDRTVALQRSTLITY